MSLLLGIENFFEYNKKKKNTKANKTFGSLNENNRNREIPSKAPFTVLGFSFNDKNIIPDIRKKNNKLMPYLRPDSKSQVTIEYDDNGKPLRVDAVVISTQHDGDAKQSKIDF